MNFDAACIFLLSGGDDESLSEWGGEVNRRDLSFSAFQLLEHKMAFLPLRSLNPSSATSVLEAWLE
ncbi:MAG: hypothetical protein M3466_00800, partial [Gemmatimonadota bacterium]|nr:hypothetical protein [Gemmatimonadota bacterium]